MNPLYTCRNLWNKFEVRTPETTKNAKTSPHPTNFSESHIYHAEFLGIMSEGKETKRNVYRKRDYNENIFGEAEKFFGQIEGAMN